VCDERRIWRSGAGNRRGGPRREDQGTKVTPSSTSETVSKIARGGRARFHGNALTTAMGMPSSAQRSTQGSKTSASCVPRRPPSCGARRPWCASRWLVPRLLRGYPHSVTHEELLARITIDPAVCHGKPCIRGHRIWVGLVLSMLEGGMSQDEILAEYPSIEPADIRACLAYASELTRVRFVDLPQAS